MVYCTLRRPICAITRKGGSDHKESTGRIAKYTCGESLHRAVRQSVAGGIPAPGKEEEQWAARRGFPAAETRYRKDTGL